MKTKTKLLNCYTCLSGRQVVVLFFIFQLLIFAIPKASIAITDHIIISEINVAGDEFVELYNPTAGDIDIAGWKVQYKSATGTTWSSKVGAGFVAGSVVSAKGYFLLVGADSSIIDFDYKHTAGLSFSDSAGHIRLIDAGSVEVDKIGYGTTADSCVISCAPTPESGKSLARKWLSADLDYQNTPDNSLDFEIQSPTPKAQSEVPIVIDPITYSTKIYFNEIFPSPSTGEEWIEIANGDIVAVNLEGWTIEDTVGSVKIYTIDNIEIDPDGLKVFYKSDTGITLNNTGDKLILKNPDGVLVDQIEYSSISNDKSWSRKEEGVDDWTSDWLTSLGTINIAPTNRYPVANAGSNITNAKTNETLNFNGSASSDSDGTITSYEWNFGDGSIASGAQVTHSYSTAGTYQISLVVRDDKGASSSGSITATVVAGEIAYQNDFSSDIKITEIMPDPVGADTEGEYIKIG